MPFDSGLSEARSPEKPIRDPVLERLQQGYDRVKKRDGWTSGVLTQRNQKTGGRAFCMLGSLACTSTGVDLMKQEIFWDGEYREKMKPTLQIIDAAIRALNIGVLDYCHAIQSNLANAPFDEIIPLFNDRCHSHGEMLAAYKHAIDLYIREKPALQPSFRG